MNRGLFAVNHQGVTYQEVAEEELLDNQILIKTEFASIKHGTEFTLFSGKSPFNNRRFDENLRLFIDSNPDSVEVDFGRFLGNTVVGTVVKTGASATKFRLGDRVYGYAPAYETVILSQNDASFLVSPMTEADAVCIDPASVALAAIRDGRICLGDNVIVFGLGAIGLFMVQLLRLAGCANIIAVDMIESRRALASSFGATHTLDPATCDVALATRDLLGNGADIAIEASGSYKALHHAIRSVRKCARVVALGYYQGKDSEMELGAEFFHNRLEIICSMPHWENPLRDYPLWDEKRLLQTVQTMFLDRRLNSQCIVNPVVSFEEAAQTFLDLYENPSAGLKMGIRFPW